MDRYQWTGTHGDMISSDLHGAEEPIRWLLRWQRQGNVVMSHCTRKKKDVLTKDTLAEPDLGGDHPLQMGRLLLMDRTSPEATGCFLEHVAVCWGHLARVAAWISPRRANVLLPGC
jgi:hypothetical protein